MDQRVRCTHELLEMADDDVLLSPELNVLAPHHLWFIERIRFMACLVLEYLWK